MSDTPIFVIKASGEKVPFEESKLRQSLIAAGAPPEAVDGITGQILNELHPGMTTKKIYQRAFSLLKKRSRPNAAKYKLKRAVMELGPSGYPFERFVGEIYKMRGYDTRTGVNIKGHCVMHEVDVLAQNDKEAMAFECKFGNSNGKKIDIKVALYVHSRVRDLEREWKKDPLHSGQKFHGGIITNATFSTDAIQYGTCAGMTLISWSFPKQGNLNQLIDHCQLYPITSMTYLTKTEKKHLIGKGIVLCRELAGRKELLDELRIPESRNKKILEELDNLCGR